jgi:hypothetical protein
MAQMAAPGSRLLTSLKYRATFAADARWCWKSRGRILAAAMTTSTRATLTNWRAVHKGF